MSDNHDIAPPSMMPMQPTGSGVADLETMREENALAADGDLTGAIDAEAPEGDAVEQPADTEEPDEQEAAAQLGGLS